MGRRKWNDENCILATDFSKVNKQMEIWEEKRDKKGDIYQAFGEYIFCLESSLEYEEDSYQKHLIKKEIKKLKKEQKKYYVPSVLEVAVYVRETDHDNNDDLDNSSFGLVKKIGKK